LYAHLFDDDRGGQGTTTTTTAAITTTTTAPTKGPEVVVGAVPPYGSPSFAPQPGIVTTGEKGEWWW